MRNNIIYSIDVLLLILDFLLPTVVSLIKKMENIVNGLENRDVIRNSIFHLHSGD